MTQPSLGDMSISRLTDEDDATPVTKIQPVQPVNRTMFHATSAYVRMKYCFTCKKYIGEMVGIYIYKDMGFCSNECRNKEMDKDTGDDNPKISHVKKNKNVRNRKNYTPTRVIFFME